MIKLYHYIHCPFCIRVRMALGALGKKFISQPLDYHDEKTPIDLCGKKMLPILTDNELALNESLDIIKYLDSESSLHLDKLNHENDLNQLEDLLSRLGKPIHNLCMPYWAYTKEFTPEARNYFIQKKSVKRGPFEKLIQNKNTFLQELTPLLKEVEDLIKSDDFSSFAKGHKKEDLSIFDIMLSSHIWGMYIFPEFQFSETIHTYLQNVKMACEFEYHEDLWKDSSPPNL